MCYTRRKIEGGVFTLRECDDTNFLKPNGQSRNLNIYGINNRLSLLMYLLACNICSADIFIFKTFYYLILGVLVIRKCQHICQCFTKMSVSVISVIPLFGRYLQFEHPRYQYYQFEEFSIISPSLIWNSMVQYGFEVPYFLYQYFVMVCINSWIFNISFTILLIFTDQYPFNKEFRVILLKFITQNLVNFWGYFQYWVFDHSKVWSVHDDLYGPSITIVKVKIETLIEVGMNQH